MITEAGNDPKVAGLVYIAAFAPDKGESVAALIKDPPPGAPVPPILPPQDGYLFLDRAKFAASFAGDVDKEKAEFMANSQVPWGVEALSGTINEPAWKTKPSWYLVATEDKMIPPGGPAAHVQARGLDGCRGQGQSRGLRVEARSGGRAHRKGRQRYEISGELDLAKRRRRQNSAPASAGGGAAVYASSAASWPSRIRPISSFALHRWPQPTRMQLR